VIDAVNSSDLLTGSFGETITAFLRDYENALHRPTLSDNDLKSLLVRCDKITEQLNKAQLQATLAGTTGTEQ
jgi:hypothetical protein